MNNSVESNKNNEIFEEKAGRKYTKKLNAAISDLVDRASLGSNPAQKIQRIANALHKQYADQAFSNKEIIQFIQTRIPSIKLKSEYLNNQDEPLYTADNQWNSRYIDPESETNQSSDEDDQTIDNTLNFGADSLSDSNQQQLALFGPNL